MLNTEQIKEYLTLYLPAGIKDFEWENIARAVNLIIFQELANQYKIDTERIKDRKYRLEHTKERTSYSKKYRKQKIVDIRSWRADYRVKNLEKERVRWFCWKAVQDGIIKKLPCKICKNKKVEAHHEDYTKPLEVVWLCRKHHCEIHRKKL